MNFFAGGAALSKLKPASAGVKVKLQLFKTAPENKRVWGGDCALGGR